MISSADCGGNSLVGPWEQPLPMDRRKAPRASRIPVYLAPAKKSNPLQTVTGPTDRSGSSNNTAHDRARKLKSPHNVDGAG